MGGDEPHGRALRRPLPQRAGGHEAIRQSSRRRASPSPRRRPRSPTSSYAMTRDDLLKSSPPCLDKVGPDAAPSRRSSTMFRSGSTPGCWARTFLGLCGIPGARIAAELLPPGRPAPDEDAPWSRVGEPYPGRGVDPCSSVGRRRGGGIAFEFVSQVAGRMEAGGRRRPTVDPITLRHGPEPSHRPRCPGRGNVYALFYDPCVLLGTTGGRTDAPRRRRRTRAGTAHGAGRGLPEWYGTAASSGGARVGIGGLDHCPM